MMSDLGSPAENAGPEPTRGSVRSAVSMVDTIAARAYTARIMLGSVYDYEIVIREQHLDSFGHVNNATYLTLFEEARWEIITKNGYGLPEIVTRRLGPVILEAHLMFRRELRNRTRAHIRSWLESYGDRVGHMVQQIVDSGGENVFCEARFVFGLFHLDERRLVEPTPEWRKAIGLSDAPSSP